MKTGGLNAIELFAGIGGFRLGLERAGHHVIWANEWDRFACDVYDANFRGERIVRGDIRAVDASTIPAHDLIVGGFPCQAFSVAGKRRGFEDTRGTLFYEIARIAAHHRTPYLLLENVKGLLSHDQGRTFGTILEVLDDLRYDVQWQVVNSKDHGVPQNRERVIIVANLRDRPRPQVFPIVGAERQDIEQLNPGVVQDYRVYGTGGVSPTLNPAAAAGGAVIPKIGVIDTRHGGGAKPHIVQSARLTDVDGIAPTLSSTDGGGSAGKPMIVAESYAVDTLATQGIANQSRIRRLTPIECERLQAFPDDWTKLGLKPDDTIHVMSDTQRYKQCGNAVTTNVIKAVCQRLPMEA